MNLYIGYVAKCTKRFKPLKAIKEIVDVDYFECVVCLKNKFSKHTTTKKNQN